VTAAEFREARIAAGLTQDTLVVALAARDVVVTRQAVSSWERGQSVPRLPVRVALIDILGLTADPFAAEADQ
jgi:DNA-binding XRE family transcriptional regulator